MHCVYCWNVMCQDLLLKVGGCSRIAPLRLPKSAHPTFITKLVRKVHLPGKVVCLIESAMQKESWGQWLSEMATLREVNGKISHNKQ